MLDDEVIKRRQIDGKYSSVKHFLNEKYGVTSNSRAETFTTLSKPFQK